MQRDYTDSELAALLHWDELSDNAKAAYEGGFQTFLLPFQLGVNQELAGSCDALYRKNAQLMDQLAAFDTPEAIDAVVDRLIDELGSTDVP